MKINKYILLLICFICQLRGEEHYEGVDYFRNRGKVDLSWLEIFLPYNPVIVEAGAFCGEETVRLAKVWPHGQIFAVEPVPFSFEQLRKNVAPFSHVHCHQLAFNTYNGKALFYVCLGMKGVDPAFSYASSLLPLKKDMEIYCQGPKVEVPCMILDRWCETESIDEIDILKLELEGMELPVLKSSPKVLSKTKVVHVKTMMHPYRVGMTEYHQLKAFLESKGFVLLAHTYTPGIIGHAIFLCRELYDAYFKHSLGVN